MIYRLQKKFILICVISILSVISIIYGLLLILNVNSLNKNLDMLADKIVEGNGRFPGQIRPGDKPKDEFITQETPFSTRHFSVWFDKDNNIVRINTESIYSIDEDIAKEYALEKINDNNKKGWIDNYRYKVYNNNFGTTIVFIDGSMNKTLLIESMIIALVVLLGISAILLLLISLLSKKVVKPIAESHEKQKQFITDANHELKTPLTLILANLDIAEAELGKNEWLDDIRTEGYRMTELVNQLVDLSRMDEDTLIIDKKEINLSEVLTDTVFDFKGLVEQKGKIINTNIADNINYQCDERLIRKLFSILLDNAIKYCDENGIINVNLSKKKTIIFTIENTYKEVENIELNKLFDRFYRSDKARTFNGGYGVGLSIAKSIVQKHHSEITSYKKEQSNIGFKITFK